MQTLGTTELIQRKKNDETFLLVNVLDAPLFRKQHIPGSINIPVSDENFVNRTAEELGDTSRPVVVYCADSDCQASPRAARRLEDAGFTNVIDYEAGMKGWVDANRPVDSGPA
jgi:rhodanese-related sulfurtransferase